MKKVSKWWGGIYEGTVTQIRPEEAPMWGFVPWFWLLLYVVKVIILFKKKKMYL